MKVVILAGGYGTRISEESGIRPKPLVEIGGKTILWHIMKIYSAYGPTGFVIWGGDKRSMIKADFHNYALDSSDVVFDYRTGTVRYIRRDVEPWQVTVVDTGEATMTGGRIKRALDHVGSETFCLTYGDGVSDIDIADLIRYHKDSGAIATVTAVHQPGRFGALACCRRARSVRRCRRSWRPPSRARSTFSLRRGNSRACPTRKASILRRTTPTSRAGTFGTSGTVKGSCRVLTTSGRPFKRTPITPWPTRVWRTPIRLSESITGSLPRRFSPRRKLPR